MNRPNSDRPLALLLNPLSLVGVVIFTIASAVGIAMVVVDFFTVRVNPYAGIFTYMILPGVATLGLGFAVAGMIWNFHLRKRRADWAPMSLPRIDLNNQSHRAALAGAIVVVLVSVNLIALTAYRAYHFSDSVEFCGMTCHSVMKPEYVAYRNSPHARVACVECHIGPGVSWFVKSKITGSYQIYSVLFKKYHRPIETPVKSLRPAQETCEQCHWPAKFFGAQQKTFKHYLADEKNSPWQIQMLIKIGGGNPELGEASGIHWHMNIKNKVEYVASDDTRETIPWVRSTDPDGHATEFVSTENPLSPADMSKLPMRRMDCVDCHNRPSHIFLPPTVSVDQAFASGLLDPHLPNLKKESMQLLSGSYATEKEALSAIEKGLPDFYQKGYPAVYKEKPASILQATKTLQTLFSRTVFPEMKTDWSAHPNHIGHLMADGCFRCHDGLHKSQDGKVITNDCNACHTILAQGTPDQVAKATLHAQRFKHPVDMGMDVTTMKCSTCHTGTTGL